MKITEIRTRVVSGEARPFRCRRTSAPTRWTCSRLPEASMSTFTFHGWLIVEIFTDDGLVGIGNAALSPHITKQVIDLYLKPLLIGQDPWDIEFLWQHDVSQDDGVRPQGHRDGGDQRGRHRALGSARQVGEAAGVSFAGRANEAENSRLREPALQRAARTTGERSANDTRSEGYKAMKLRFGWGPTMAPRACSETSSLFAPCARRSATGSISWPTRTWVGRSITPSACCRCSSRFTCVGSRRR